MSAVNFEERKTVSAAIWRICLQINVLRNSPLKRAFFLPPFSLSTQKANTQLSQYVGEKQCWFIILHTHLKEVYDALLEKWEAYTVTFHRLFRILLLTNLVCLQWNRCSTWICAAVFFSSCDCLQSDTQPITATCRTVEQPLKFEIANISKQQ